MIYKLKELIQIKNGCDYKALGTGDVPVYGSGGLMTRVNKFLYDGESVLLPRKGTLDNIMYVCGQFWTVDTMYWTIVDKSKVLPLYLYYYLSLLDISSRDSGSTLPSMTFDSYYTLEVDIPDIQVQQKVVNVIQPIDRKIKRNSQINDNLSRVAYDYFVYMFADKTVNATSTLSEVAQKITDGEHGTVQNSDGEPYYLLSCKNIKNGHLTIDSEERTINKETFSKLRKRTELAKGDVLITSVGSVGEAFLLNTDPTFIEFQRSVAMIKPNTELITSSYLFESLVFQQPRLVNAAHGAVQQCLFLSDIADLPIYIPTKSEVMKFDSYVQPMLNIITANDAESQRLINIRDWVLPMLMSGQATIAD